MSRAWFRRLSLLATLLTFVVVVLGAYVRLSDAGLGCPDWPGCYGHIGVPGDAEAVAAANAAYPDRPVAEAKGWKEMIHRYVAGTLGVLVAALAFLAWRWRHDLGTHWRLAFAVVAVVVVQSLLGMWTVTWKLKPLIVMAHLLGGLTVLSLLWLQTLRSSGVAGKWRFPAPTRLRVVLAAALAVLVAQIALGGWTSANYAALACNELPTCTKGQFLPTADFAGGFDPWHGIGPDYEYGQHLAYPAKVAIHLAHRFGAVAAALVLGAAAWLLWRDAPGRRGPALAGTLALVLAMQLLLGVGNVLLNLPLAVAVAHNAIAALLLLAVLTPNYLARSRLSA